MALSRGGMIVIAIVVIVVIVAALVMSGVVNLNPSQIVPSGADTNKGAGVSTTTLCEKLDANMSAKLLAIASDRNSSSVIVSPKNEKASFFLLFKNKKETGVIDNNKSLSAPRTASEVADVLKNSNVEGVILVAPQKAFVDALKSKQIPCYVSTGALPLIVGATSSTGGGANGLVGPSAGIPAGPGAGGALYCKDLNSFTALKGKKAVLATDSNVSSLISSLGEKSPYILVFDVNGVRAIRNTVPDNNRQVQAFVALLKANGLKSVVLSNPSPALERELKRNVIACYKAVGIVSMATTR